MVAYNFQPMFEPQIVAFEKLQTIRPPRKRHAQSGEPVQLFTGLRKPHCRKLLDPDPICLRVRPVEITTNDLLPAAIASIAIDGISLDRQEIERFAISDGFAPKRVNHFGLSGSTARENMGAFWLKRHGIGRFDMVLVQWGPT
jgi:hypothetical protein